jgi:hypothetical protein
MEIHYINQLQAGLVCLPFGIDHTLPALARHVDRPSLPKIGRPSDRLKGHALSDLEGKIVW